MIYECDYLLKLLKQRSFLRDWYRMLYLNFNYRSVYILLNCVDSSFMIQCKSCTAYNLRRICDFNIDIFIFIKLY